MKGSLPNGIASSQFRWSLKVDALPELIGGGTVQEVKLPEIMVRVAINR